MVKLLIDPADGAPFERSFQTDSMVIGRASTSDLPIPDPFLSRHHARLFRHNGEMFIEDLDSRNGTEVNGALIENPTRIRSGDSIRLSGSTISVGHRDSTRTTVDLQATVLRPAIEFLRSTELDTQTGEVDAHKLRSYADRLHRLNEIYKAMGSTVTFAELSDLLLETALKELSAEHAALVLRQPDGSFERTAGRSREGARGVPPLSRKLVEEVCGKGMSALISDATTDERFSDSQSLILSGLNSLAAAPLLDHDGTLGMVVISSTARLREFKEEDLEFLTSIASVAALKIRNLRLAQAAIARQRQEQELRIARRIQESLLPQHLPAFSGLDLFARNTPSRGVSGDFFQIRTRPSARCLMLIVDVSGKGVPAALLTASIEALAVGPIEDGLEVNAIFEIVSRRLYVRSPPEKYATALLVELDDATGEFKFANAGHNPALVLRAEGTHERLESDGRPLGLVAGSTYQLGHGRLSPGDCLLAYTDGLTEAENLDGEQYGMRRLTESAVAHHALSASAMGEAVLSDIEVFASGNPPTDDCTVVIARRR